MRARHFLHRGNNSSDCIEKSGFSGKNGAVCGQTLKKSERNSDYLLNKTRKTVKIRRSSKEIDNKGKSVFIID
jgi:hypothetical protein